MEEIEERKFNRMLKVAFTETEKVDMVEAAGSAYRDLKKAQDDLATVKAQFQSKIKEHEAEISSLFERINTGWEMRSVPCREVKDFVTGSVVVFRDDTQELIEERAMTGEERQPALPFKEEAADHEMPPSEEIALDGVFKEGLTKVMEAIEPPAKALDDLPEDTNPFYMGKKDA